MGNTIMVATSSSGSSLDRNWRKSSYSHSNGHCVEVSRLADGSVGVRDSKDRSNGPVLRFGPVAWTALLSDVRNRR
jgi:hypothetical protein